MELPQGFQRCDYSDIRQGLGGQSGGENQACYQKSGLHTRSSRLGARSGTVHWSHRMVSPTCLLCSIETDCSRYVDRSLEFRARGLLRGTQQESSISSTQITIFTYHLISRAARATSPEKVYIALVATISCDTSAIKPVLQLAIDSPSKGKTSSSRDRRPEKRK